MKELTVKSSKNRKEYLKYLFDEAKDSGHYVCAYSCQPSWFRYPIIGRIVNTLKYGFKDSFILKATEIPSDINTFYCIPDPKMFILVDRLKVINPKYNITDISNLLNIIQDLRSPDYKNQKVIITTQRQINNRGISHLEQVKVPETNQEFVTIYIYEDFIKDLQTVYQNAMDNSELDLEETCMEIYNV